MFSLHRAPLQQALLCALALACGVLAVASAPVWSESDGLVFLEKYEASDREFVEEFVMAELGIDLRSPLPPLRFYRLPTQSSHTPAYTTAAVLVHCMF